MDDVKVHYNSSKPTQLQALAFTQGRDIHVGPGQERHLPHEAWHVVQQKQGRVKPTMGMKGIAINDDLTIEKEADVMGRKALTISPHTKTRETRKSENLDLMGQLKRGTRDNTPLVTQFVSKFVSTTKRDGQIYGIYQNPTGDATKLKEEDILYVGKTNVKDVGQRFVDHVNEDDWAPWHEAIDWDIDDDQWPYVPREKWGYKQITDFDVAVAEQYFMQEAYALVGDQLQNRRNEITFKTFNKYKGNPSVFTTSASYPATWAPRPI